MNLLQLLLAFIVWVGALLLQFKDLLEFKEFGLTGIIALAELAIIFWMIKRFIKILDRVIDKKGGRDE